MDNFMWPHSSSSRLAKSYGLDRNSWDAVEDHATSEHIEKKKKLVADLMALRKMKLMKNPRRAKGRLGQALEGPTISEDNSSVETDDLKPLLESTVLKEELDRMYGDHAMDKAAEHFSALSSNFDRPDSREKVDLERTKFLGKILQKRKDIMDHNREKRKTKQQTLIDKQLEFERQDKSYQGKFDDELPDFIDETEKKLKSMEQNLKFLKMQHAKDLKRYPVLRRTASFERFKANHPKQVEVASWIIDIVLDKVHEQCIVNENNALETKLFQMLLSADKKQYDELQSKVAKSDATLAVMETIIEETSDELINNLAQECLYLSRMAHVYAEDMVIYSSHALVAAGDKSKAKQRPDKIVDESFLSIKSNRERLRVGMWTHTQATVTQEAPQAAAPQAELPPKRLDTGADSEVISSENSVPKLSSSFGRTMEMARYAAIEGDLWKSMVPEMPDSPLAPKVSLGVNCTCLTSDHSLLAVGSYRGDIFVYDMTWLPSRPIRCVAYVGKKADPIESIHWSLDNSRIVTLSAAGCVVVWSFAFALYVSQSDITALDISYPTYNSQQLTALCVLEAQKGDFQFKEGSLSETANEISLPCLVNFHPGLSICGTQDNIVVALKSGDILKCNLSNTLQRRCQEFLMSDLEQHPGEIQYVLGSQSVATEKPQKISQGIETEVFRHHRHDLLQLCFIKNGGDMVSLDTALNLCQWKHNTEQLNSFGWFVPFKKFKLSFVEEILVEKGEDDVIFEDVITLKKTAKGKKTKSKQVIEKERRQALRELQNLNIESQIPWHSDEFPDQLEDEKVKTKKPSKYFTRVYAPSDEQMIDASAGGASFIVVMYKRDGGLLVKFALRTYESTTKSALSMLNSLVAPFSDRMYFMLLYDEHLPKIRRHVSFVDLDLEEMQLGKIGPIQINLSEENFTKCLENNTATFSLSRVDDVSGTEYIGSNICGNLKVHSLLSGRQVVHAINPEKEKGNAPKPGMALPTRVNKLNPASRVIYIKPDGFTSYIVILPLPVNKPSIVTRMIRITEPDDLIKRQSMQITYKYLVELKKLFLKSTQEVPEIGWYSNEQTCKREIWSHRHMPKALYMRLMLNTVIDVTLARATGVRMPQDTRKKAWKRDWLQMQEYFASQFDMK